jgi:hypothetical protein
VPEKSYSGQVLADGTLTLTVTPTYGQGWLIGQVTVELATAPSGATCELRRNGFLVTPTRPRGGVSAGDPYVRLLIGDELTVKWTGCTPGSVGKALVLFDLVGQQ